MKKDSKVKAVDANGKESEFEVIEDLGEKIIVKNGFLLSHLNSLGQTIYYFFEEKNYPKK